MSVTDREHVIINVLPEPDSPKHTEQNLNDGIVKVAASVFYYFQERSGDEFFISESDGCTIM